VELFGIFEISVIDCEREREREGGRERRRRIEETAWLRDGTYGKGVTYPLPWSDFLNEEQCKSWGE
jgi:hypothetical protein